MGNFKFLKLNLQLLQFTGLIRVKFPGMMAWRVVCAFSVFYFFFANLMDLKIKWDFGFDAIVLNCINAGVSFTLLFKTIYYYSFLQTSEKLINTMYKTFKYSTNTGFIEKSIQCLMDLGCKLSKVWIISAFVIAESYGIVAMLFGENEKRNLPYPQWYPYNVTASPMYELTCVQQFISHALINHMECVTDSFYASMMLLTVGQFELLGWEIEHVVYKSLVQFGVPKEVVLRFKDQFNNDNERKGEDFRVSSITEDVYSSDIRAVLKSKPYTKILVNNFNRIVRFHQDLLNFCDDFNDFFAPILLVHVLGIMTIMLFTIFFVITSDSFALRVTLSGYMIVIPFEIFCNCILGELLISQNEKVQKQLYGMAWYHCDKTFKSSFIIVLDRIREPPKLNIGKFAKLNLVTFVWIMKSSFSYATFLQQMTE